MTWNRAVMLMVLVAGALAFAQPSADQVYEEGKALYDAKNYAGALQKFDEAAALDPSKARWQYNRGLALKKLKRNEESRAAFMKSRELDPGYKRGEIDEKLNELGGGSSGGSDSSGGCDGPAVLIGLVIAAIGLASVGGVLWKALKAIFSLFVTTSEKKAPSRDDAPSERPKLTVDQLGPMSRRIQEQARALGQVEHALSLGEDAEVRRDADRAATNLATARKGVLSAARGELRRPEEVHQAIDRAAAAIKEAQARLVVLHGDRASSAKGPRAGCFFCARALPSPKFGESVQLRSSKGVTTVAACPTCARRVATGTPPPVLMVDGDQRRHWSELDEFDPYVEAHAPPSTSVEVPAWNVMNAGAAIPSLATFAGGAVLGALGAVAAGRIINLDNLKESSLASAAAEATARAATSRRTTEYSDHS
ncbi:MAG: tetratricopeptide repeat protein [Archangiaceae bacterium]|nr:tetratricopeptide repeat protein [Archangiaceae bacterium]